MRAFTISALLLLAACQASTADSESAEAETVEGASVVKLAAGSNHTCAILTTGAVRCWGWNGFGQLGSEGPQIVSANAKDIPAVNLDGHRAVAIAAQMHRT